MEALIGRLHFKVRWTGCSCGCGAGQRRPGRRWGKVWPANNAASCCSSQLARPLRAAALQTEEREREAAGGGRNDNSDGRASRPSCSLPAPVVGGRSAQKRRCAREPKVGRFCAKPAGACVRSAAVLCGQRVRFCLFMLRPVRMSGPERAAGSVFCARSS